jgi:hypothetical protein
MSTVESRDLAIARINGDLRSGRLESERVQISDGKETKTPLNLSDWQQLTVEAPIISPMEGVRVDPYVPGHYFVRRVDLDKRHSIAEKPKRTAAHQSDDTRPPGRRRGPIVKYEWHAIAGEIARRCIDSKTGRVLVPKNERNLARQTLDWCQEKYGEEPAESEMREVVRVICAAMRTAQK